MHRKILLPIAAALFSATAPAQQSGQNVSITVGIVEAAEAVTLQSTGGGKGAVVGGTLGAISGGDSKSSRRKNALIGGTAGALVSRSGESQGMQYAVRTGSGQGIVVVSDQTQIKVGDCVSVEQSGDRANIRRLDPVACDPGAKEAVAALQDELIEEANECDAAKQEIHSATGKGFVYVTLREEH